MEQIHLWEHDMSALFYYEGLLFIPSAKGCIREHPKPRYFLRASMSAARRVSLWGEGKRKRFPLQPFAKVKVVFL